MRTLRQPDACVRQKTLLIKGVNLRPLQEARDASIRKKTNAYSFVAVVFIIVKHTSILIFKLSSISLVLYYFFYARRITFAINIKQVHDHLMYRNAQHKGHI